MRGEMASTPFAVASPARTPAETCTCTKTLRRLGFQDIYICLRPSGLNSLVSLSETCKCREITGVPHS